VNLLILDEPTNHLDLHSKDILLDALNAFTGTIIFVSHDRAFMEALSTKTLELRPAGPESPGTHRLFYGNYAYYLDRLNREAEDLNEVGGLPPASSRSASSVTPLRGAPPRDAPPVPAAPPEAAPATPKRSSVWAGSFGGAKTPQHILIKAGQERPLSAGERREAEKQKQALTRRLRRQEAEILAALEALEAEKTRLEHELARPEVYANGEKARAVQARLETLAAEIETKTGEWEATAAELGGI
jgi:ATP-binding cassette subfamily F protein 3